MYLTQIQPFVRERMFKVNSDFAELNQISVATHFSVVFSFQVNLRYLHTPGYFGGWTAFVQPAMARWRRENGK